MGIPEMNYQGPGLYRHYKGGYYEVLGLALQEDDFQRTYVIYEPTRLVTLLDDYKEDFWARELSDFNAEVQVGGHQDHTREFVPRFRLIEGKPR